MLLIDSDEAADTPQAEQALKLDTAIVSKDNATVIMDLLVFISIR